MRNRVCLYPIVLLIIVFFVGANFCEAQSDSLPTPFRKGRWVSGISGIISSTTNIVSRTSERSSTNKVGLNINGGKFFKDRWLVGGSVLFDSSDFKGGVKVTSEVFFVGPLIAHYFSDSPRGSLFLSFSPGFTRYQDRTSFEELVPEVNSTSRGSGFGFDVGLGYSYVIQDRIAFDIGFDYNQAWYSIEVIDGFLDSTSSENISISNLAFSFGFRILLNKLLE
ncbi:MAG: outer membrane beta-barrel protein [Flavobacteriaceae bacterium]